ncbi:hypothetical protein PTRA_a1994 [Pseudoalteromonas translucida KMM 520]|uniref:Uncharacterized protein n=1 Tax=Pseudoalteromonas translucida KMM 520 TaxID=1315283 RepID=A0A0U2WXV6_9GAMM|nr:hypothetical protein PTRA_a1994 [Pseudoalteromonas translucida KMM 520]
MQTRLHAIYAIYAWATRSASLAGLGGLLLRTVPKNTKNFMYIPSLFKLLF